MITNKGNSGRIWVLDKQGGISAGTQYKEETQPQWHSGQWKTYRYPVEVLPLGSQSGQDGDGSEYLGNFLIP